MSAWDSGSGSVLLAPDRMKDASSKLNSMELTLKRFKTFCDAVYFVFSNFDWAENPFHGFMFRGVSRHHTDHQTHESGFGLHPGIPWYPEISGDIRIESGIGIQFEI